MEKELYSRLLIKYNSLITELESINLENTRFVDEANLNPDSPEIIRRMNLAHENYRRLQSTIAERDLIIEKMNQFR